MGNIYNSCRLPLRMKLAGMLLMGSISMGYGITERRQSASLFIEVNNESVQNVLKEIECQSEYSFFYDNQKINTSRKVSIRSDGEDVFSILEELFEDTNVTYKVLDNSIILSVTDSNPAKGIKEKLQSYRKVTGVITDPQGEPIIGANVVVKGTTLGTITGLDGDFSLEVPDRAVLLISFIGYVQKEVTINKSSVYRVKLQEDTQKLDEVIVTALGIKREEKALGYSVQKVGSEELTAVKGTDVATSLTGKIAGLSINNSSEISEAPELQLRGENPLIVVDGVAYGNFTLSDISADDIESIDVLKGATASALYGVRGRAGAVMITTKRGKSGELTVNVSNNTMFQAGYLRLPEVQSSYSTGNYGRMEYNSGYVWGDYMDGREVEQYDPETMTMRVMPLVSKGRDNVKNFMRPGLVTNTNVNVSQSGELGDFRVSATQVHQNGQYPNSSLDKYIVNMSGNITYKKFKLDAGMSYKKMKSPNMPVVDYGGGNILYNMLIWGGTEYDIRDFKNYWKVPDQQQNWGFSAWYDNPYFLMNERIDSRDNNLFNANATLSYDIMKNLKVTLRSGFDNYDNGTEKRRSVGDSGEKRGYYEYRKKGGSSFNNDLIVNGDFTWKYFTVDAIVGLSSFWYKQDDLDSWTRGGLSVPGFYSLNASVERPGTSKEIKEKALYSIYGKVGLSWKSAIYVDLTARNDWSSTLPSDSRSYFYPSVSGSFIPTAFYNPLEEVLDFWKVRASWTVAKKDLSEYEINRVFDVNTDVWNGMSTAGYPSKLRDPNIKPETEASYEFGTDFRFFNNRLGFDYTFFSRLRYDRLIEADISEASGAKKIITNTAEELRQRGMEFTLTGKPIVTKEFQWESALNVAYWHWYYDKLDPVYSSQDPRIGVGERYDKYFFTDWETDHAGNIVHQAGLPVKNKYQSVIGYKDPKCILGWTNRFFYKGFDLSVSIDGRIGGVMYSWTEQAMWHSGVHPDSDNRWRYDEVVNGKQNYIGSGVKVVSGSASYDPYGKVLEDTRVFAPNDVPVSYQNYTMNYNENPWDHDARQNIKNGSFLKLREVALNYTLPATIAQKLLMKKVRVGVIGQNLLMWTKEFKFSDPDRGKENLNTPTSRYVGFNIDLTF